MDEAGFFYVRRHVAGGSIRRARRDSRTGPRPGARAQSGRRLRDGARRQSENAGNFGKTYVR